jgi:cobalt/nickel transport system permease protein
MHGSHHLSGHHLSGHQPNVQLAVGSAPHARVVATLLFVVAVVATPREQWWAFVVDGALLGATAATLHLRLPWFLGRLTIELPFVMFAVLLPVVGRGPTIAVLGVHLSRAGLWAAWAILAKGTLGVGATVVLNGTTPVPELLAALDRLRVPGSLTAITGFMLRYGEIITGELHRLRIARESRGDRARWLWQAKAVGATAGTLFVRSYERGERVFLAMESRGWTGAMPITSDDTRPSRWARSLAPGAVAALAAAVAWWSR